ncbi:hypothetical protein BDV96DRAFT_605999 [Lophiotrema nucula]|uniref:DUF6604 domain-containing protein n=1 Tax=Lophiotrema nucula TaxID=690887 RepID=A0A6A5YP86_9PLEO|nr:hypothetical protein BDV96DRAFT_605999 [Lophiotrema nucula]
MAVYKGLKSDTDVFTSWTVSMAQALGHDLNSVPRQKGSARTGAKGVAGSSKRASKVSSKDLRAHAAYIANNKAKITMPMDIFRAVKRAIASRKYQTKKYELEEEAESEDTVGHKNFTKVLEEVCAVLSTRVDFKLVIRNKDATEKKKTRKIENLYSALELEETDLDDAMPDTPPQSQSSASAPKKLPPPREFELALEAKEEVSLRIECLKADRTELLKHISLVAYRAYGGVIDLGTAAMVIGAAIAQFKHEEEEIIALAESINLHHLLQPKDAKRTIYDQTHDSLEDIWTVVRNTPLYIIPLQRLHLRKGITSAGWEQKEEFLVKYIPDAHIDHELRTRTWENAAVNALGLSQPLGPASLDELTKEIYRTLTDHWSPLTMSFAAEILWTMNRPEMHNRVDSDGLLLEQLRVVTEPLKLAADAGFKMDRQAKSALEKFRTIQHWIESSPVARQKYNVLRRLPASDPMSGIQHDILPQLMVTAQGRAEFLQRYNSVPDPTSDPQAQQQYLNDYYDVSREADFLRRKNPMYCGKLLMDLLLAYEEVGLASANSGAVLLSMAHIYVALLDQKILVRTWPRLTDVINTHIGTLFLGKFPDNPQKAYNRLLLASGFSATLVTALKDECEKNPRLASKLKRAKNSASKDETKDAWAMTSRPVVQILREHFSGKEPDLLRTMYRIDNEFMKQSKEKLPRSILDGEGTVAFLTKLEAELSDIANLLNINYVSLACACTELFQQMYEKIIASDASHGSAVASEDWKAPNHRGYGIALRVLGELEEDYLASSKRRKVDTPTTDIVASVLSEYIAREHPASPEHNFDKGGVDA